MRILGCLLAWLTFATLHGQFAYEGVVRDAVTGNPIPFVNIGLVDRGIGTISNEYGEFLLEFRPHEVKEGDIVRMSSLGYLPHEIPISLLQDDVLKLIVRLKPKPVALDEIVLTNKKYVEVEDEVGYRDLLGKGIGYWKDSVALGAELASRIRVRKGLRRLNALFFNVLHNPSDSVRLRVNIYEVGEQWGTPGKNLNESGKNILHVLKADEILTVIDLRPYNIWVRDDFIASLELLGVYGTENISLSLPAGNVGATDSFRRYASQGSWERIDDGVVGFWVQSTFYTDKPGKTTKPRQLRKRAKREREISGTVFETVTTGRGEMRSRRRGATVSNYTSNTSVTTDEWGRFRIKVVKGDIIGVSYPGMHQVLVEVEDNRFYNFQLYPVRD